MSWKINSFSYSYFLAVYMVFSKKGAKIRKERARSSQNLQQEVNKDPKRCVVFLECDGATEATSLDWKISACLANPSVPLRLADMKLRIY
jgi:hypothetical protein